MSRRAFIIYRHPLFGDAVRLLLAHGGVDVLGMESDLDLARQKIDALQPDVVLMELGDDVVQSWTPTDLTSSGAQQRMTIGVNLLDNQALIWHRQEKTLLQGSDLVEVIQSSLP